MTVEMDHADVLTAKDDNLGQLGATPTCRRTVVPTDLAARWDNLLRDAGHDPAVRTMWLAEGLCYYLTTDHVTALAHQAAVLSTPGSLFAADNFGAGLLRLPAMADTLHWYADNGRPPPFCTDEPADLCTAAGWHSATLAYPGAGEVDHRRLRTGPAVVQDSTMRTYLVAARR
ncbi:MAG TPA: class I SAM-dependent methyltransferase [Pseudonocardiaceae bacterium]|nr:class I SAM-dependent methyltransferase [Pseudonocardiaceae bacterium]